MNNLVLKIQKLFKRPLVYVDVLILFVARRIGYRFSDKTYLKLHFRTLMRKKLHLKSPRTFNEKLQWLKLYDRNPIYHILVDKYAVKKYIADVIGEEYVIPTIAVYDDVESLNFARFPPQFVLKTSHGGGGGTGVLVCADKSRFNEDVAKQKLREALTFDMYTPGREWVYKDVPKRILVEKYMGDGSGEAIKDYKFFCFNGKCKMLKVDFGRFVEHRANYYDTDWNLLPFGEEICPPAPNKPQECPLAFNEMIRIAEKLAKGIPFVRVDLYNVNGQIYFGEMTFFPASGIGRFIPEEADMKIGQMLNLPKEKRT